MSGSAFRLQATFCARNREALVIEKRFYTKRHFHIFAAIRSLTRPILLRLKHWEFSFPIPKHVSLNTHDLANLTDLEEELIGDRDGCLHVRDHSFARVQG